MRREESLGGPETVPSPLLLAAQNKDPGRNDLLCIYQAPTLGRRESCAYRQGLSKAFPWSSRKNLSWGDILVSFMAGLGSHYVRGFF